MCHIAALLLDESVQVKEFLFLMSDHACWINMKGKWWVDA